MRKADMRNVLIISTIVCFFVSCSKKQNFIYYNYKGTIISRLDKGNHIFFYYGKVEDVNYLPKSYIEATYNGFDGLMGGFLIFKEDRKVEMIRLYGLFSKIGNNNALTLNHSIKNNDFMDWKDKIHHNYNNVIELSDVIKTEQLINKNNNSQVKVIYPNE